MKLDTAAAAFKAQFAMFTVHKMDGVDLYEVRNAGTVLEQGISQDDAVAYAEREAGRAGVTAVLREMISPNVIGEAANLAGLTLTKWANNDINRGRRASLALLEAIILILSREAQAAVSSKKLIGLLDDPAVASAVAELPGRHA